MSTTTSEIPQAPSPAAETRSASTGDERGFLRRYTWWLVALGVLVLSAVIVRALGTRPGYDPYGWLIWGRETLAGTLDLGGAPSWKPLPYLFTVPVLGVRAFRAVAVDDHVGRDLAGRRRSSPAGSPTG